MKTPSFSFSRLFHSLRAQRSDVVASFVDDPLRVQKEIRFLLLRLSVFLGIAVAIIVGSVISVGESVARLQEKRLLQSALYARFESAARLSHDVTEGRDALAALTKFFPKDDTLLQFLRAMETFAKETGNQPAFLFEQSATEPSAVPGYRSIRYSITLTGDLRSFLRYLYRVYALPYPVVVEGVVLSHDSGLDLDGATMQVEGKLYAQ